MSDFSRKEVEFESGEYEDVPDKENEMEDVRGRESQNIYSSFFKSSNQYIELCFFPSHSVLYLNKFPFIKQIQITGCYI